MYTQYAGDGGMLLHIWKVDNGKTEIIPFVIQLSCFLSASMFSKTIKYEAEVDDFVVSLTSGLLGYIESTYEWN
jgi:hypothetical protein